MSVRIRFVLYWFAVLTRAANRKEGTIRLSSSLKMVGKRSTRAAKKTKTGPGVHAQLLQSIHSSDPRYSRPNCVYVMDITFWRELGTFLRHRGPRRLS